MKNSIFSDLDKIIEAAVGNSTEAEEIIQNKQASSVKKAGLVASKNKNNKDVEEADSEDEEKKASSDDKSGGAEKVKKITGKPGDEASAPSDTSKPGTRTSKKLSDPPEKVLKNPQYPDIQQKINTLRGASSLSKKPISASVQQYLKTLSVPEKAALLTYLTNLSQLMAPVRKPDEVNEPSDVGLVTKFKGSGKKSKEEKPAEEKKEKPKDSNVVVVGED